MCMYVYIASSVPLPMIPFDEKAPAFSVGPLEGDEKDVCRHFTKPHVYYVGALGCGCDFQYGEYPEAEAPAEVATRTALRKQLSDYLRLALQRQSTVEVYACWAGDESLPEEFRIAITPADLTTTRTFFREREFMLIRPD